MRTLVVAPQPFFTPRGTPFSVYYRTLIACELGARVDLLTYGEGQDVDIPGARIVRIPRFPFVGQVPTGPSFRKLFLDFFMVLWAIGLLAKVRYEIVQAHEESIFFCFFLKRLFRFKLVYDMHSSLPEQFVNFHFTRSRVLISLFRFLEGLALRGADAVVTVCPEVGAYAVSRMKDPGKHFLIENSIFEDVRLVGGSGKGTSSLPFPDGRPVVLYAGSFEPYQGVDLLLHAFHRVREKRPDAYLLVLGGDPGQVRDYQDRARRLGLDGHCLFAGRVPPTTVKEHLSRANVLTSPRLEGTNTPLKIYEQVASGVPLVATRVLSHTQVLNDRICFLVQPDAESMAEGILAALDDRGRREAVSSAAREHYRRNWSRPAYKEKMRNLYETIT